MEISKVSVNELNNAVYNPRKDLQPTDPEYVKLKNSIEHFGYVEPIIVNKNGNIVVGGHQRLKVLKDLGYEQVDVVFVELNVADEKALNIALNKISGDWDAEKLEDLLRDLSIDEDYDVELTGFDLDEIENLFGGALDEASEEFKNKKVPKIGILDDEVDAEEIQSIPVDKNDRNIKLGDIYKLGRHTLMCGDSTDKANVIKLIGDKKIELCITDPPYPQQYTADKLSALNKSMHKYKGIKVYSDEQSKKTGEDLLELSYFDMNKIAYLPELNVCSFFIFTSKDGVRPLLNVFNDWKYDIHTWCKINPTPFKNGNFLPDIEYCLHFYNGDRVWNNTLLPANTYKKYYISSKTEGIKDNGNEKVHPTMKPLEMISNKMQICSNPDGYVLDLFGGSGSTLIVAEQLGRNCLMMEYEPKYMNVIIDRWEKFTGEKAEKLGGEQSEGNT